MSFEQAYRRLQEIHKILQSDEVVDVDKILEYQKEAKELYEFCHKKLKAVDR